MKKTMDEAYGEELWRGVEYYPIKKFPLSMIPIPKGIPGSKFVWGTQFIICTNGIVQYGGKNGKNHFTPWRDFKDLDGISGRIHNR